MNRFEVTDAVTGAFVFQATGHGFKGIPCVDANGQPTGEADCALDQRSFKACAVSGCHGSENGARSALITVWTRFDLLTSTVDAMVAQVPASEFKTGDNFTSTGEGAKFNSALAKFSGSAAHNPFLVEALLTATIKQLRIDYGIPAPAGVNLTNTLSPTTN
jgi:hypothetical protein